MISKNIMKIWETSGLIQYAVSDGSPDDDNMIISFVKDINWPNQIRITFWKKIRWVSYWGTIGWFHQIWKRIVCAWDIISTGVLELQDNFELYDEESINSFIEALEEGKKKLKEEL